MLIPNASGLYIVTLNNYLPISVNANDPRVADKAIKVTRANCKVGKAKNLARRASNYTRVFGLDNTNFHAIALTSDIDMVEHSILSRLEPYRILGRTGRKNEWLHSIEPTKVLEILLKTLRETGVAYQLLKANWDL